MKTPFTLSPIFSSNMVFQADRRIRIFGSCKKGIELRLDFLNYCTKIKTKDTTFVFDLEPLPKLSESFSIILSHKKTEIVLENCVVGDVFLLCGSSNMEMTVAESYENRPTPNPKIRYYQVPQIPYIGAEQDYPDLYSTQSNWKVLKANDMNAMGAIAYHVSKKLAYELEYPIGIIQASYEQTSLFAFAGMMEICSIQELGKFCSNYKTETTRYHKTTEYDHAFHEQMKQVRQFHQLRATYLNDHPPLEASVMAFRAHPYNIPMGPKHYNRPSGLYETMIKPMERLSFKGAVLYFGEDDIHNANVIQYGYQTLIDSWRKVFKDPKLPFVVVQIAGYSYEGINHDSIAKLRQAQRQVVELSNHISMATAVDLGEEHNPLPREKEVIGKRIANVLLERVYRLEKNQMAPAYFSHQASPGKLVIYTEFNNLFLTSRSMNQMGFTVSYDGTTFQPLKNVQLVANQIVIQPIKEWKEIRYCYENYPNCDIFTTNDLPLLPFRIVY